MSVGLPMEIDVNETLQNEPEHNQTHQSFGDEKGFILFFEAIFKSQIIICDCLHLKQRKLHHRQSF
jgi:hypothetical protein